MHQENTWYYSCAAMTVCEIQEDTSKMFGRSGQVATDMNAQLNNGLTSCALSILKEYSSRYIHQAVYCSPKEIVAPQLNSTVTLADGYTDGEYGADKVVQERNNQCR